MKITFKAPTWNSEEGVAVFNSLSTSLPPNKNIFNLATVTTMRLLVYLPDPICKSLLLPVEAMPLLVANELAIVREIVKARLEYAL